MNLIVKKTPPPSFLEYKNKAGASFEEMDSGENVEIDVKGKLKEALLKEQNGICAYCQQKIKSLDRMKIEHHCEQSICNGENGTTDRRLDYTNLFSVCLGDDGRNLHCDSSKATFKKSDKLPIEIIPTNNAHINSISYTKSGLIKSSNSKFNNELNEVLNLNLERLKNLRREMKNKLFKNSGYYSSSQSKKKDKLKKAKLRRLAEKRIEDQDHFQGMIKFIIQKYC